MDWTNLLAILLKDVLNVLVVWSFWNWLLIDKFGPLSFANAVGLTFIISVSAKTWS